MAFTPDAWQEVALITITRLNGADIEFAGLTESIDIDEGDKDIEYIPILNGGGVTKDIPAKETTITMECYPIARGGYASSLANGFDDIFHSDDSGDVTNSRTKDRFRIAILWTKSATTTGSGSVAAATGSPAYRRVYAEARLVSHKTDFTDKIVKSTVKFKVPPFGKDGASNIKIQDQLSTGSAGLTALTAYTQSGDTIVRW